MQGAEAPWRDEVITVGIDSGKTIRGQMWNGSSWSALPINDLGNAKAANSWTVDVAYERQSGGAVLVWASDPNLMYSVWNGSSWTTPAIVSAYSGVVPQHMQLVASPDSDEMTLILTDNNGDDFALVWNGSSWGNQVLLNATNSQAFTDVAVAYEQQSGDAIVVYAKDTTDVFYRVWNGSSWSSEATLTAPSGPIGKARWTMMAADPTSDRIVLGVLTESEDAYFAIWDGTTWTAGHKLSATLDTNDRTYPNIAVAFEHDSGKALVTYGAEDAIVRYRTWNRTSGWSAEQNGPTLSNKVTSMTLDSDPRSNRIMLSALDENKTVQYVLWDSGSWGAPSIQELNSGQSDGQPFLFLWEQDPNVAPVLDNTKSPQLNAINEDAGAPSGAVGTLVSRLVDFALAVRSSRQCDRSGHRCTFGRRRDGRRCGEWYLVVHDQRRHELECPGFRHQQQRSTAWRPMPPPASISSPTPTGTVRWPAPSPSVPGTRQRGNNGELANTSANGGSTAFSTATDTASLVINAINDDPTNAGILQSASTVTEDVASGINLSFITLSDIDAGAGALTMTLTTSTGGNLSAAAGTGITIGGSGTGVLTLTGNLTDLNAYLDVVGNVTYLHGVPHTNGFAADTVRVDVTDNGNTGSGGGSTVTLGTFNIDITPVNDAPSITNGASTGMGGSYSEDGPTAAFGVSGVLSAVGWSDVDAGAVRGMVLTGTTGNGTWQYSTDMATWNNVGAVSGSNGLLLSNTSWLRYVPDGLNGESPTIQFRAWDETTGTASTNATPSYANPGAGGGTTAFSSQSASAHTLIYSVNDAPVLDDTGDMTLTSIFENETNSGGTLVSDLIASAGGDRITDPDPGAVEGIAITFVDDSNGTWQYSTNGGGSWFDIGAVSDSSALVLTATPSDMIRFVPDTSFNGTVSITFRAWDTIDGSVTGQTGVNVTVNGGSTAFSAASESATISVAPVDIKLYLSTSGDVVGAGTPGINSWARSDIVAIGDPGFALEAAGAKNGAAEASGGTLYNASLNFLNDSNTANSDTVGDVQVTAMHYVSQNITVGNTTTIDLLAGDLLLAVSHNSATFQGTDLVSVTVNRSDVFVLRPDAAGNYSSGRFFLLFDNVPGGGQALTGIALAEQTTTVGQGGGKRTLDAGTLLYSWGGNLQKNNIYIFEPDQVGATTTGNRGELLINGDDISLGSTGGAGTGISGIALIENAVTVDGVPLTEGTLLVSLTAADGAVGNIGATAAGDRNDIYAINVSNTGAGTTAEATLFYDGSDLGLDASSERIDALAVLIDTTGGKQNPNLTLGGGSLTFTEDDSATVIAPGASVSDGDSPDFAGGALRVAFSANGTSNDRLSVQHQGSGAGQVGLVSNLVQYAGVTVGTLTGGVGTVPLVITFNSNATAAVVQAVTSAVTYNNISGDPSTASRTVQFQVTDGDGGTSNVRSKTINVVAVNDNPAITSAAATAMAENTTAVMTVTANDPELDPITYHITGGVDAALFAIDTNSGALSSGQHRTLRDPPTQTVTTLIWSRSPPGTTWATPARCS